MTTQKGYTVEVSSRYDGWWRYNVALMCGCFDAEDNRTGFSTASSEVAAVGANLAERPAEVAPDRSITLSTPACDHLMLYVYIIPHTLPTDRDIDAARPFDIDLAICFDGRKLRTERRAINQWSGASIEMRVSASENK